MFINNPSHHQHVSLLPHFMPKYMIYLLKVRRKITLYLARLSTPRVIGFTVDYVVQSVFQFPIHMIITSNKCVFYLFTKSLLQPVSFP